MLLLIPGSRHAASTCKPGFVVPSRARVSCFSRDREPATGVKKGGAKNCRASCQHAKLPAHPTWTTSWLSSLPLPAGSTGPRQLRHPKGSPLLAITLTPALCPPGGTGHGPTCKWLRRRLLAGLGHGGHGGCPRLLFPARSTRTAPPRHPRRSSDPPGTPALLGPSPAPTVQ